MKIKLLSMVLLSTLCCCSKIVDVQIPSKIDADAEIKAPDNIGLGPDFEKAAKFCDNRYLPDKTGAESCFQDFRNFYSIKVGFDLTAIIDFCEESYSDETSINECIDDLGGLFEGILGTSRDNPVEDVTDVISSNEVNQEGSNEEE